MGAELSFAIFDLKAGHGTLGLSPMPGRSSYQHDLAMIARWDADLVLTMTPLEELARVGAEYLGQDLSALGIAWAHLPIADFGAPQGETAAMWPKVETQALDTLGSHGKVLAHCYGGCGRSGMAILRLMISTGEAPETALARLRAVRPCAVETDAQFRWASAS